MARPVKPRKICGMPEYSNFAPMESYTEAVQLSLEEYEVIRLVDYKKLSQEQCAAQMEVARTTVTAIYDSARTKIADCIVNGKMLEIVGGDYRVAKAPKMKDLIKKGTKTMRIAVTYENGEIFQHFGRTEMFKVYDVENEEIKNRDVVGTNGAGHGALAGFLNAAEVDVLICGGIGGGAQAALADSGIELYAGNSGSADEAVEKYLAGNLEQNTDVSCHHHEHHDHDHGCGDHGHDHGCGGHGHEHGCGR